MEEIEEMFEDENDSEVLKTNERKKDSWKKPTKLQIFNLIMGLIALGIAIASLVLQLLKLK